MGTEPRLVWVLAESHICVSIEWQSKMADTQWRGLGIFDPDDELKVEWATPLKTRNEYVPYEFPYTYK